MDNYNLPADLKPGDKVAWFKTGWHSVWAEATVTRVTKTQVVIDGDRRFTYPAGRELGKNGKWDRPDFLYPLTDEYRERIRRSQEAERRILDVKYIEEQARNLDAAGAARVAELVRELVKVKS